MATGGDLGLVDDFEVQLAAGPAAELRNVMAMVTLTGIMRAVAPSRPPIADWRSWVKEPTVSVVLMILRR